MRAIQIVELTGPDTALKLVDVVRNIGRAVYGFLCFARAHQHAILVVPIQIIST